MTYKQKKYFEKAISGAKNIKVSTPSISPEKALAQQQQMQEAFDQMIAMRQRRIRQYLGERRIQSTSSWETNPTSSLFSEEVPNNGKPPIEINKRLY